jgi:hypothetical protein
MQFGGRDFHTDTVQWYAIASMLLAATALCGCGRNLSQVSGVVTLDGQPLRGGDDVRATVCFQPSSGSGTVAMGLLDEHGRYRLSSGSQEGVVPGEYVVTFSASQLVRSTDGRAAGGRRITDASYADAKTSGFKFTVEPGQNEFDLALNSQPGAVSTKRTPY